MSGGTDVVDASTSLVLRLFGDRWLIDLSGYDEPGRLVAQLTRLWARVYEPVDGAPVDVVFRPRPEARSDAGDGAFTARVADSGEAFPYAFSRALTQAVISHLTGSGLLLHAAGLTSTDGERGVVMVASSGTGKSTAARTLGRRFGYLSDELMRVDADHRMHGLPKPLSIIVPGFPGGKDEVSPDEAGLAVAPAEPPALAAMVCLQRDPDAAGAELTPISVHELIAEVLPQSSSIWRGRRPLHHLVEAGVRGGGPYRLSYAEIAEAEGLVADLLASGPLPEPGHGWAGHLPSEAERWKDDEPRSSVSDADITDDTVVSRSPWTDAIESEDEVSVLSGSNFCRIAGIAATMWLMCARPRTVAELMVGLVREHGPHPDAAAIVRGALRDLATQGMVRVDAAAPSER